MMISMCLCVYEQFATQAKRITNKPVVNVTNANIADPAVSDIQKQMAELNIRLQNLQV